MSEVAVVCGAGTGVGRAVAVSLAKEGKKVVVVGRSTDNTMETLELVKQHSEGIAVVADVGSEEDTLRYMEEAVKAFGRVDIFVNSAARFQPEVLIGDTDVSLFDDIMRINLRGAFLGMKYAVKQMEQQGGGVIVNVASRDGLYAEATHGSYSASKHAMLGLTKNVAAEYGSKGIRTCAVCPGAIDTKMIAGLLKVIDHSVLGPMQRPAEPQEIADIVCYLCSDKATYLNGSIVRADGGMGI